MFQTVDLRLLHLARRIGDDLSDPAATHCHELVAHLRRERRDRWAVRLGWLRAQFTGRTGGERIRPAAWGIPAPRG